MCIRDRYSIDFDEFNDTLHTPVFKFHKQLVLQELREAYPNVNLVTDPTAAFPLQSRTATGLYFEDSGSKGRRPAPVLMRVWFEQDKLKGLELDWYPEYSSVQWDNYVVQKEKFSD